MNNLLKTSFLGVAMDNPVIMASGCFGFGSEYCDYFDPNLLGGMILKGLTLEPRDGNSAPRIAETPSGMLNAVGLENPGVEVFCQEILPSLQRERIRTPLIANINGRVISDYVAMAERLNERPEIAMIELNISCPNVKDGGMAFGANPEVAGAVTKAVRAATNKPLLVKLSPNVTDIASIAKIVEANGADGISLINTLLGMSIDLRTRKPLLGNKMGGLSGPAIKPVALRMVYQVYQAVNIPLLGLGGIMSANDALEFIFAGASTVAIGTGVFTNPRLPELVINELADYCAKAGVNNISELVGAAHD